MPSLASVAPAMAALQPIVVTAPLASLPGAAPSTTPALPTVTVTAEAPWWMRAWNDVTSAADAVGTDVENFAHGLGSAANDMLNSSYVQNAIGGVKSDVNNMVGAGPASLLTRLATEPEPNIGIPFSAIDPGGYQEQQQISQLAAGQVYSALAWNPSNPEQLQGYNAATEATTIASLPLGGYGLLDAGYSALTSSYALRSPFVLGDVPYAFGQSGAINLSVQNPLVPFADTSQLVDQADQLSQIQLNRQAGADFQARVAQFSLETQSNFVEELSIIPNTFEGPADFRVRLDSVGQDTASGGIVLTDAKSSATAGFTPNQEVGYPLIEQYGGTVVGAKGGNIYPAGTSIPPTTVTIIRPGDLPEGY